MEEPAAAGKSAETSNQRREVRVGQRIPLTITWVDKLGDSREESAETDVLNSYGCRLSLEGSVEEGMTVVCSTAVTGQTRKGRIIWIKGSSDDKRRMVGLELLKPGADFWGKEAQVALQEAGLIAAIEETKASPKEIEEQRTDLSRRGLLYTLLSGVVFYFLGGYSALSFELELNEFVKLVLLPLLFFSGLGLAFYASVFYLRRE